MRLSAAPMPLLTKLLESGLKCLKPSALWIRNGIRDGMVFLIKVRMRPEAKNQVQGVAVLF